MCTYRAYHFTCTHIRTVCLSRCNGSIHNVNFDDWGNAFLQARCALANTDIVIALRGLCWHCYYDAANEALKVQQDELRAEVEAARRKALERFIEDREGHEARLAKKGVECYDKMLMSCDFEEADAFKAVLERARVERRRIAAEQVVLVDQEERRLGVVGEKMVRREIDDGYSILPRANFRVSPRREGGSKLKFEYVPDEEDSSDEAVYTDSDSGVSELELCIMDAEEELRDMSAAALEKLRCEIISKLESFELDGSAEVDPGDVMGDSDEDPCRYCPGCDFCCGM